MTVCMGCTPDGVALSEDHAVHLSIAGLRVSNAYVRPGGGELTAAALQHMIDTANSSDAHTVIAGDLNACPGQPRHAKFVASCPQMRDFARIRT